MTLKVNYVSKCVTFVYATLGLFSGRHKYHVRKHSPLGLSLRWT